jgi:hypothetical protein
LTRLLIAKAALGVDRPIFIMLSYPIGKIIGRKSMVMPTTIHRLEETKFVFTMRTEVRLGGFNTQFS